MIRKEKAGRKSHIGLVVFLMLLLVILALMLAVYLVRVETVQVRGNEYIPEERIISEVFPDDDHKTLLHILLKSYVKKPSIRGFDSVTVRPVELKAVTIDVKESAPIAQVKSGMDYVLVTKDGIIMSRRASQIRGLILFKGLGDIQGSILEKADPENASGLYDLLEYACLFEEYGLSFDGGLELRDGQILAVNGEITILFGTSEFSKEKVIEVKSQEDKYAGLSGTLHMEDYSDENVRNGYYFVVE